MINPSTETKEFLKVREMGGRVNDGRDIVASEFIVKNTFAFRCGRCL